MSQVFEGEDSIITCDGEHDTPLVIEEDETVIFVHYSWADWTNEEFSFCSEECLAKWVEKRKNDRDKDKDKHV